MICSRYIIVQEFGAYSKFKILICTNPPIDGGSFRVEGRAQLERDQFLSKISEGPFRNAGDRLSHDDPREIFSSFGPFFGLRDIADLGTSFIAVFVASRVRAGLADFPADDSPAHTATLLPHSAGL